MDVVKILRLENREKLLWKGAECARRVTSPEPERFLGEKNVLYLTPLLDPNHNT